MFNITKTIREEIKLFESEYRGHHRAPSKNDAPLYDLTKVYPDDVYSDNAARYYGDGFPFDELSARIIRQYRNKPNAKIKIYRTVPKVITNQEKINFYEKHKAYIQKYGRLPKGVDNWDNRSEYYEYLSDEIERLKSEPNQIDKVTINAGDWVTINPYYAKTHGDSELSNIGYRILTKTVLAKELYSEGNSLHEWGYNP